MKYLLFGLISTIICSFLVQLLNSYFGIEIAFIGLMVLGIIFLVLYHLFN